MKSMTGYGRATVTSDLASCTCEIQSVNRKHLDLKINIPAELRPFEPEISRILSKKLTRGAVTLRMRLKFHGLSPIVFSPNSGYASSAWEAAQKLQEELGIEREGFAESLLLQQRDLLQCEDSAGDNEALKELLIAGLEEAFADFDALRAREGRELKQDFARRLQTLEEILATLENLAESGALTQKEKLTEKLKTLLGNAPLDDLIARELALLADKVDVCEELVRFRAHLSHFSETMELPGLQGKTLDFILQEMFREINTIGSKTQDAAVTRKVVEAKTEIERIREQVQNIE